MNVVVLRREHTPGFLDAVDIEVDGTRLVEHARIAELPAATRDGQADLAGTYAPLHFGTEVDLSQHFGGAPAYSWFDDGDTVLLGCECGEWGCWPLTAEVVVSEESVTWRHFRTGHREWDLSALGPFEFEREQYDRALRAVAEP